ncbi:MAG: phosphate signaling complex protein PhoU [Pseudomonadota bacterium]
MAAAEHARSAGAALMVRIAQMGGLVEQQLVDVIAAVERRDPALGQAVMDADVEVDASLADIEKAVTERLRRGGLSERALRESMSVLKIAGELERIGDLAKNIGKRSRVVSVHDPVKSISGVMRMGRISLRQVTEVLNALGAVDVDAAMAVWSGDDELDELHNSLFEEILGHMDRDKASVAAATHLVFIAKNFERVGDHATNIAESVYFLGTGTHLVEARPKSDVTPLYGASVGAGSASR